MRLWPVWLAAAIIAGAWLLALAYYVERNGIDCYPSCSTSQDAAGVAVTVLPVLFVVVVIVALVQSWRTWSSRRSAKPE